jgi:Telomeric repeat-binding factor 2.
VDIKKYSIWLIPIVLIIISSGCTGSNADHQGNVTANSSSSTQNTYQDLEWANHVSNDFMIFTNDTNQISNAMNNNDFYTASSALEKYKQDIATRINNTDNFVVSQDLQSCKDEYKLALLNEYNAVTFMKSGINQLTSGNILTSSAIVDMGTDELRLANSHYDNVTRLMKAYNSAHPNSQIELKVMHHNVSPKNNSTGGVVASDQTSAPVTKTLADKEPDTESEGTHASESTTSGSTNNIFNYCTWQAEITKKISDYYEAPENKSYVVVTLKINNTGDQTYSTNPGYWHLKIGDMYYQSDSPTYDSSLNHMTTDVGPGGKITTKIAYLVDGDPSISDMDIYYDGPGSDGTIHS